MATSPQAPVAWGLLCPLDAAHVVPREPQTFLKVFEHRLRLPGRQPVVDQFLDQLLLTGHPLLTFDDMAPKGGEFAAQGRR